MTKLLYLYNGALKTTAEIVATGSDTKGEFVQLDQTVFHPAGGGQKSDIGFIGPMKVIDVRKDRVSGIVNHYIEQDTQNQVFDGNVELFVDASNRALQSKYHSAGHLIASIVEDCDSNLVASGGHHWPGEARVEFPTEAAPSLQQDDIQQLIEQAVSDKIPVKCFKKSAVRHIQFGKYKPVPCGGTHVTDTSVLSEIKIKSVKFRRGLFRVSYEVGR